MPAPETHIDEIESNIYRVYTPVDAVPGGFNFNQYLVVDDEPLLFHTGPRALASSVIEAVERVLPFNELRYIGFAHVESDECGGLTQMLAKAPNATPVCSRVGAMVSVNDIADRPPLALANDQKLQLGKHTMRWLDAPHVPHGWDNGFLFEETTATLFCGDLFTQPGTGHAAITESDVLAPSEAFRNAMDYFAHAPHTADVIRRLAQLHPQTLACMHGSAFRGDGGTALEALAGALSASG